jgi:NADPH:quinone reductase-like Zn-dependent oxidoreductase
MATNANARETMLAVVSNAYGSPDVLEYKQLPKPTPLDGEVLLQVHAAGIHAGTPLIAAGIPWVMRLALGGLRAPPPDSIAGTEVAGKVVAIGSNVKTLKVGDAVFGEIVLTSRRVRRVSPKRPWQSNRATSRSRRRPPSPSRGRRP